MVSSAYSVPQNLADVTGVIPDRKFQVVPGNLPLELPNRSETDALFMPNQILNRFTKNILIFIKNSQR